MHRSVSIELADLRIAPEQAAVACQRGAGKYRELALDKTICSHLVEQCGRTPDAPFVHHGEISYTYATVLAHTRRVIGELVEHGCQAGDVVCVLGRRSIDSFSIFLALEAIGAIYAPLDTSWPTQRLRAVFTRLQPRLCLTYLADDERSESTVASIKQAAVDARVAHYELHSAPPTSPPSVEIRTRCSPSEARYIFHTSGTTGEPKGAVVEHQGMINHIWSKIHAMGLDAESTLAFSAPLAFDIAIWQVAGPLLLGCRAVVLDDDVMAFPRRTINALRNHAVAVLQIVPAVADWLVTEIERQVDSVELPELKWLISTGEELRPTLAERILKALPATGLLNSYGFTETSDDVAHHVVRLSDTTQARVPVGHAIDNCRLYVLVEDNDAPGMLRCARDGEPGELYVGGLAAGPGYAFLPDVTRSAYFVDTIDPASSTGRIYKSGDAAMLQGGLLYCHGRVDRQVKVGGHRVELEEIEAALDRIPGIRQHAVVSTKSEGRSVLHAFYATTAAGPGPRDLRLELREHLPAAMVPKRWTEVDSLPLNSSGKTDYQSLMRQSMQEAETP